VKRLNPKTGKPFKRGDKREDGMFFTGYSNKIMVKKTGYFEERWTTDVNKTSMQVRLGGYKRTAAIRKVPFNLTVKYLESIKTDACPIFKTPFEWQQFGRGKKTSNSPTLDRIVPELGYVEGNVVWISDLANRIKSDATEVELYAVADWLHDKRKEVLNAFKIKPTPVSAGSYIQGAVGAELGSVSTPWTWEDSDYANDYRGAVQGENSYRSAKEGSGNSLGRGDIEVGAPKPLTDSKDIRLTEPAPHSVEEFFERVRRKSRELDLATGTTRSKIPKSGD
jgi:hypothetical protein